MSYALRTTAAVVALLVSTNAIAGCDGRIAGKRKEKVAIEDLRRMLDDADGDIRVGIAKGIELLENGIEDETPYILFARFVERNEEGEGPWLFVQFISEVLGGGTLEIENNGGGWTQFGIGEVRPIPANERLIRTVLMPTSELRESHGVVVSGFEGQSLRIQVRNSTSNATRIKRWDPKAKPSK